MHRVQIMYTNRARTRYTNISVFQSISIIRVLQTPDEERRVSNWYIDKNDMMATEWNKMNDKFYESNRNFFKILWWSNFKRNMMIINIKVKSFETKEPYFLNIFKVFAQPKYITSVQLSYYESALPTVWSVGCKISIGTCTCTHDTTSIREGELFMKKC